MRRIIFVWCAAVVAAIPSASVQIRPRETNLLAAIRNTPLPVAQQSLLLARSWVVKHCYSEAIRPLLITAEALAFVEAQEIGRYDGFSGAAGWVRQEILDYTNRIETNNSDALRNIDAWRDQVSQWSERRNRPRIPPGIVGAYMAAAGEGYAPTLRRRVRGKFTKSRFNRQITLQSASGTTRDSASASDTRQSLSATQPRQNLPGVLLTPRASGVH